MLTAIAATEAAEGISDVSQYVVVEIESLGQQVLRWITYLMIVIVTVGAVRVYDRYQLLKAQRLTKEVGSQTQTTYTMVRGAAQPRFRVLPEHAQG